MDNSYSLYSIYTPTAKTLTRGNLSFCQDSGILFYELYIVFGTNGRESGKNLKLCSMLLTTQVYRFTVT